MKPSNTSEPTEIHLPCEDCGSSDALSRYSDGHTYCFSCGSHHQGSGGKTKNMSETINDPIDDIFSDTPHRLTKGILTSISDRGITQDVCDAYGVTCMVVNGVIQKHYYPYHNPKNQSHIANKVRTTECKAFTWEGDCKNSGLFGQHMFPSGGKYLTITEGEVDCLSVFQIMGAAKRFPVVSIKNGASGAYKEIKENFEWVNSFDNIVLCFDNDEPGRDASEKVASLFEPRKVKVVRLRKKDPNEYLTSGLKKEFTDDWWNAERFTPAGIVCSSSLWETVKTKPEVHCVEYPWTGLNELTYGMRTGELVTITAGSGMGKTQLVREISHHLLKQTKNNIGMMMLEETLRDTGLGIMSIEANKPLHLPDLSPSEEEMKVYFDATLGSGRLYLFDHFGSSDVGTIVDKIRFLVQGCDCKFVILDHISIVVSDQQNGDERKALDEIATKLKTLTVEQDFCLIMISHLRRSQSSKPHEEGGQTSLSDLRGTAGIGQLSNIVLGLERNGQAEDITERNTTTVRVLKNRFSGLTGPACKLTYDKETGRLTEIGREEFDNKFLSEDVGHKGDMSI